MSIKVLDLQENIFLSNKPVESSLKYEKVLSTGVHNNYTVTCKALSTLTKSSS